MMKSMLLSQCFTYLNQRLMQLLKFDIVKCDIQKLLCT